MQAEGTSDAIDAPTRRRAILAGTIGNLMEYYDFAVYASLTPVLAALFFPTGDRALSFLAAFGTYAVGFFMRPLGGFVFGHFGDKVDRRTTLAVAVLMMAVSTFLIGVLPTYSTVGLVAPALLVLARLIQGFSASREWGDRPCLWSSTLPLPEGVFSGACSSSAWPGVSCWGCWRPRC